jgi:hypothetical protein
MKYLGPLRVISNVETSKIGPYINLARNQIGMQKSSNNESVKSNYRYVMLPDGTVVETWYNFNNHSCKVTVPGVPTKPVEVYIPGIVMAPIDDVGKWGYGSPFSDPLGTACPTYDIVKYGSSLLTPTYDPGTTDYKESIIIRPWKQPGVDPVAKDDSYTIGTYAHPMYSTAAHDKYIGNFVLPGNTKNYGTIIGRVPFIGYSPRYASPQTISSFSDRNDGYRLLEYFKQTSIGGVVFVKGIPKVYCGPHIYSYHDRYINDVRHDIITYSRISTLSVDQSTTEGYYSAGSYDITEHGKTLETFEAITNSENRVIALPTVTIPNIFCGYLDNLGYGIGVSIIGSIQLTDRYFMIYHSYPILDDTSAWGAALSLNWKLYRYSSDLTSATLESEVEYPAIPATLITEVALDGGRTIDIAIDDVSPRIIQHGHTYSGETRLMTVSYSNVGYIGTIGNLGERILGDHYNVDMEYILPDGNGGDNIISLNCSGSCDGTTTEMHHETFQSILWDAHTDCYIYVITSTNIVRVSTDSYRVSGNMAFYRNGTQFHTYSMSNRVMSLVDFELPWIGQNLGSGYLKLEYMFLAWFTAYTGDEGPLFEGIPESEPVTVYFSTPITDFFIWWKQEIDYEMNAYVVYSTDRRSVVDPGADLTNSNKVTFLEMKDLEEGNMANTPIIRFSWWNNELLDEKSIEEMLLIDEKTNPRITNFGVI